MTPAADEPIVTQTVRGEDKALRFEYRYSVAPERLWSYLTNPKKLRYWFPCEMSLQHRREGSATFTFPGEEPQHGSVLEYNEPRLLAFTWGSETLRWELLDDDGGTRLVLTNTIADPRAVGRMAAGWHLTLLGLDDLINERELGQDPALWDTYVARYQQQFGEG